MAKTKQSGRRRSGQDFISLVRSSPVLGEKLIIPKKRKQQRPTIKDKEAMMALHEKYPCYNYSDISRQLKSKWSRSTVARVIQKFQETGPHARKPRTSCE